MGVGKTYVLDTFAVIFEIMIEFECGKMSRKNYEMFVKQSMTYKDVTNLDKPKMIRFDDMESLSTETPTDRRHYWTCKDHEDTFRGNFHTKHMNKISEQQ